MSRWLQLLFVALAFVGFAVHAEPRNVIDEIRVMPGPTERIKQVDAAARAAFDAALAEYDQQVAQNPYDVVGQLPIRRNRAKFVFVGAGGGNDRILIAPQVTLPVWAIGRGGNDFLQVADGNQAGHLLVGGVRERIARVQTPNARTARVVFKKPFAGWRDLFGALIPAHKVRGQNFNNTWANSIDISSLLQDLTTEWEERTSKHSVSAEVEPSLPHVVGDERLLRRSIEEVLHTELDKLHRLSMEGTALTGTPTGYKDLDEMTGGFQPGNLIIVAARPAMGKSAIVGNIADFVAVEKELPVAFFSLEMSETELAHRFLASQAKIPGDKLRKGQVKSLWPKVLKASNQLAGAPIWIDTSSDLSALELRAKARRLHSKEGGLGLVIVDYIQLMRPDDPRQSRVEQVGAISRGLKLLAGELNVPVLALQVSFHGTTLLRHQFSFPAELHFTFNIVIYLVVIMLLADSVCSFPGFNFFNDLPVLVSNRGRR